MPIVACRSIEARRGFTTSFYGNTPTRGDLLAMSRVVLQVTVLWDTNDSAENSLREKQGIFISLKHLGWHKIILLGSSQPWASGGMLNVPEEPQTPTVTRALYF